MRTDELDYELDPQLIATRPVEPRDAARLLVLERTPGPLDHRQVHALPELLEPGDALVLNETRVVPARVHLHRPLTGARFEGLVLPSHEPGRVGCYLRGAKKLHAGDRLELHDADQQAVGAFEVLGREGDQVLLRVLEGGSLDELLEAAGEVPLPPYILGARKERGEADDEDPPGHAAVDDEASAVINREAAEAAGDLVDPDVAHDAAISTLGKVLGATVITDSST